MQIRVYYEDTDCGGIVYHASYIKYCERARSEKFFTAGLIPAVPNSGFVVRSLNATFIGSATLGDTLEVQTQITQAKNVSVLLHQEIYKISQLSQNPSEMPIYQTPTHKTAPTKIFEMDVKLGYIDFTTSHPTPIPKKFLEVFNAKQ
ncbi:thioesterase family protein [Helicobacter sp. 11S02596-1]|uniref:YbgC/FadM family acyl-CoA thioesterase n=1 Tax=Helicobacter sp. 11S02596-1 TaxID=1476194 RepID=UPI000BA71B80|nr:thioesterase family protein [Helicobacter sp. 11S02596-1]PAF41275.1 hypothetical protein BJI48_08905 [Helicobacter sp. 11S02596-1]